MSLGCETVPMMPLIGFVPNYTTTPKTQKQTCMSNLKPVPITSCTLIQRRTPLVWHPNHTFEELAHHVDYGASLDEFDHIAHTKTTPNVQEANGGSVIAMKGKDCVAIACDLRLGNQALTVACNFEKVRAYDLLDLARPRSRRNNRSSQ